MPPKTEASKSKKQTPPPAAPAPEAKAPLIVGTPKQEPLPPLMMETKTGVIVEVLELAQYDKRLRREVSNFHPFVKSKIYEANEALAAGYTPPFSIDSSNYKLTSDDGHAIWQVVLKLHGSSPEYDRTLRGSASCYIHPMPETKTRNDGSRYEVDNNDDWAEKAETKAIGRALAFAGFGNVLGSSIASAEDVVAYRRRAGEDVASQIGGPGPEITTKPDGEATQGDPVLISNKPKKGEATIEQQIRYLKGVPFDQLESVLADHKMLEKIATCDAVRSLGVSLRDGAETEDGKKDIQRTVAGHVNALLKIRSLPADAAALLPIEIGQLTKLLEVLSKMAHDQNAAAATDEDPAESES